jgi:hypothetical protein
MGLNTEMIFTWTLDIAFTCAHFFLKCGDEIIRKQMGQVLIAAPGVLIHRNPKQELSWLAKTGQDLG